MAEATRPVAQRVTVCDLCGEVIVWQEAGDSGSLLRGYIAHDVAPRTKHVWLIWPVRKRRGPHVEERHYDFHGECIGRLVEQAVDSRIRPTEDES